MARKAKDLYQLLQHRRTGGRGRSQGSRKSAASGPASLWDGLQQWLGLGRAKARSTDALPRRRGVVLSGPALAAIVFASLGVGYLLGDAFGLGAGDQSLRAAEKSESGGQGRRPGPIGEGFEAFELPADSEAAVLYPHSYLLAGYGGAHRERAADLAIWFRSQGIETTRIRRRWVDPEDPSGGEHWLTVAYYPGPEPDPDLRDRLRRVPAPPGGDRVFAHQRKTTTDWPPVVPIQ